MEQDLLHSGLTSYMDENYKTAIDQFTKCLEKSSDNFEALIYRGCSYIKIGNYTTAIADFNNAEKIKENNYDVLYNRSKAHFLNMDFKSGQEDLSKVQQIEGLTGEQKEKVSILASRFS